MGIIILWFINSLKNFLLLNSIINYIIDNINDKPLVGTSIKLKQKN